MGSEEPIRVDDTIDECAERVQRIEEQARRLGTEEMIEDTLPDPDFAATLQGALIAAARTSGFRTA